jgi:hypothetical protein
MSMFAVLDFATKILSVGWIGGNAPFGPWEFSNGSSAEMSSAPFRDLINLCRSGLMWVVRRGKSFVPISGPGRKNHHSVKVAFCTTVVNLSSKCSKLAHRPPEGRLGKKFWLRMELVKFFVWASAPLLLAQVTYSCCPYNNCQNCTDESIAKESDPAQLETEAATRSSTSEPVFTLVDIRHGFRLLAAPLRSLSSRF